MGKDEFFWLRILRVRGFVALFLWNESFILLWEKRREKASLHRDKSHSVSTQWGNMINNWTRKMSVSTEIWWSFFFLLLYFFSTSCVSLETYFLKNYVIFPKYKEKVRKKWQRIHLKKKNFVSKRERIMASGWLRAELLVGILERVGTGALQ